MFTNLDHLLSVVVTAYTILKISACRFDYVYEKAEGPRKLKTIPEDKGRKPVRQVVYSHYRVISF
jgi:hypothetical protein